MSFEIILGLLLSNLLWALNPAVAKIIINEIGPEFTAWIKYAGGLATYVFAMSVMNLWFPQHPASEGKFFVKPTESKYRWALLLMGVCTCFIAPMTQAYGLTASTAVNNALLVSFEPIFTVFFGWLLLNERLSKNHFFSFGLAIVGFFTLSSLTLDSFKSIPHLFMRMGDLILLMNIWGESMYSVFGRGLSRNYSGHRVFGTAMLIGLTLMSLVILPTQGFPPFHLLSLKGWIAVVWFGALGTTVPYLIWMYALKKELSLGSIALTLFLQPVFGAAAGILLLGEVITASQIMGGFLILLAVLMQTQITHSPRLIWQWLKHKFDKSSKEGWVPPGSEVIVRRP